MVLKERSGPTVKLNRLLFSRQMQDPLERLSYGHLAKVDEIVFRVLDLDLLSELFVKVLVLFVCHVVKLNVLRERHC